MKLLLITLAFYSCRSYSLGAEQINVRVTTIFNPPWLILNSTNPEPDGAESYGGYVVDLLSSISNVIPFNYTIQLVKDGQHGSKADGKWSGMIGEVLRSEADIAAGDLTITSARSRDVDFSRPYVTTGIGLLIRRPPYYLEKPSDGSSALNFNEDLSSGSRPLIVYPYTNLEELANQNLVQYGALAKGSTYEFFKTSKDPLYKKIGDYLVRNENSLPKSYTDAAIKVYDDNGKYVFFMEGTTIDYLQDKDCDYASLGKMIGETAFGFAMRKGFPHKEAINWALASLHEDGTLDQLKRKYFPSAVECKMNLPNKYAKQIIKLAMGEY